MVLVETILIELMGNMVDVLFKCLAMCLHYLLHNSFLMKTCFYFMTNKCAKVLC